MALVHEQMFEAKTDSALNFNHYAQALSAKLYQAYSVNPTRVRLETEIDSFPMNVDHAMNCGLILNELLANSLKHAFPKNGKGVIKFRLKHSEPNGAEFSLVDNGVGLPAGFNHQEPSTLGLTLVRALVSQLEGDLQIQGGKGTAVSFSWTLPPQAAELSTGV